MVKNSKVKSSKILIILAGLHTSSLKVERRSLKYGLPEDCLVFGSVCAYPFSALITASGFSFSCKDSLILLLDCSSSIMVSEEKADNANKSTLCDPLNFIGTGKPMADHGHNNEGATMVDKTRCEPILVLLSGCIIAKRSW